jgi:hypothetical protein
MEPTAEAEAAPAAEPMEPAAEATEAESTEAESTEADATEAEAEPAEGAKA